jgi:hypothetical protein
MLEPPRLPDVQGACHQENQSLGVSVSDRLLNGVFKNGAVNPERLGLARTVWPVFSLY